MVFTGALRCVLVRLPMHFAPTVTLGDVIYGVTLLIAAAFAYRDLNWRIRNIEDWKDAHFHTSEQALANISLLQQNAAAMKQIAEGQERRIQMLEDFVQSAHERKN